MSCRRGTSLNAHARADARVYTPIHSAAAESPGRALVTASSQQLMGE